jgi:hypothetical protein
MKKLVYGVHAYRLEVIIPYAEILSLPSGVLRSDYHFDRECAFLRRKAVVHRDWLDGTIGAAESDREAPYAELKTLYYMIGNYKDEIKTRVLSCHYDRGKLLGTGYAISSNNKEIIAKFAKTIENFGFILKSLTLPWTDEDYKALTNKSILSKVEPKFKYKVTLSSKQKGYKSEELRKMCDSVLLQLDGLDETDIEIPRLTRRALELGNLYYSSLYVYVNNPDVLGFLPLINPNIIGRIYTLQQHSDK